MPSKHKTAFNEAIRSIHENKAIEGHWKARIEELSKQCPYRKCRYFLALLTCYLVARSAGESHHDSIRINLPAGIKKGFQLRGIARDVAEVAALNNIDIGSTSSDCLNGAPSKAGDVRKTTEIKNTNNEHGNKIFQSIIEDLGFLPKEECQKILTTYCKTMQKRARAKIDITDSSYEAFLISLTIKLKEEGDYGNIAAATVGAGIFTTQKTRNTRIHVGKTNDPDRRYPCDVTVIDSATNKAIHSYEVKDKKVTPAEIKLALLKMETESCLPQDITFCLFKGIEGRPEEAIRAIGEFGYTPKIFSNVVDFLTFCLLKSELECSVFTDMLSNKMNELYGEMTM